MSARVCDMHCPRCGLFVMAGECDCLPEAASAVSGIENEPGYEPRFAYLLEPAFKRWPLGTPLVLCVMLLAALGFVGSLDLQAALAAAN